MPANEVIVLVGVTFLIAGIVKGVSGFGLPVIAVSLLAATVGLKTAVAVIVVPCLVTNLWQAFSGDAFVALLKRLWMLFLGAAIGIWFGVGVLAAADALMLTSILGCILVLYAVLGLVRAELAKPPAAWEPWLTPVIGATGGLMFGMVGNFMVPGVLYIQALGLPRDRFVQALGMTFIVITAVLAVSLSSHALMPMETAMLSAAALLPTVVGMLIGRRVRGLLTEAQFRNFVFIVIGVAGIYMVVRSYFSS